MGKQNIVVFDLETTGLDKSKDYIIQFSAAKFNPETYEIIESKDIYIKPEGSYTISIQAYLKHHITPEFLEDKPYFFEVAEEIRDFIGDCDILSFNGNGFDIPFLIAEFERCHMNISFLNRGCYDAFLEEKRRNGISLGNTYKRYTGKTMEEADLEAHNAASDIMATIEIFKAQQEIQPYGPEEMFGEDNFITNSEFNGEYVPCFAVGKYKQIPLSYVATIDQGYLNWCVGDRSKFTTSTKDYIKQYIK